MLASPRFSLLRRGSLSPPRSTCYSLGQIPNDHLSQCLNDVRWRDRNSLQLRHATLFLRGLVPRAAKSMIRTSLPTGFSLISLSAPTWPIMQFAWTLCDIPTLILGFAWTIAISLIDYCGSRCTRSSGKPFCHLESERRSWISCHFQRSSSVQWTSYFCSLKEWCPRMAH